MDLPTGSSLALGFLSINFLTVNQNFYTNEFKPQKEKNWTPGKNDYICSEHFLESELLTKPGLIDRRLVPNVMSKQMKNYNLGLHCHTGVSDGSLYETSYPETVAIQVYPDMQILSQFH